MRAQEVHNYPLPSAVHLSLHIFPFFYPLSLPDPPPPKRYAGTDVKTHYFGRLSPMCMCARARVCFCSAFLTNSDGRRGED